MPLSDNLVAYWSLEEASGDAIDAHGSNDLTETSGTIASTTGKVGNCRDFEAGDTEYFTIADNADLSMGDIDFTIAGWFQLESKAADMCAFMKGTASDGEYYLQYQATGGTDRLLFSVLGATGFGSAGTATANNLGSPSTGTWYFVVCWHDAASNIVGIQVNNGTANTTSHSAGVINGSANFDLGAYGTGASSQYWDGLIDEVGIWKRVLTSDEKTELYNSGNGRDYAYLLGDVVDPELDTATIQADGSSVELGFSESVTGVNEQEYNIDVEGFPMGLADQTGSGAAWELPFSSRWVRSGETVTLDYTGTATVDGGSNQLAAISGMSVTNNSIITEKMIRYVGRKLGLFLHFSLNTFVDEEFGGGASFPADFDDPDDFAPTEALSDCVDQWILCAKRMGAQYIVLTAKHINGFKIWPSAHGYNLTESSWYAGAGSPDLIDIFTTKCRAAGLGVGIYFCVFDRYFEATTPGPTYTAWTVAELTELLSNYGNIDLLWFDGWNWVDENGDPLPFGHPDFTDVDLATVQALVTGLQPDCAFVVNSHMAQFDEEANFDSSDVAVYEGGSAGEQVPSGNPWPSEEADTIRTDNYWFWKTAADNPLSLSDLQTAMTRINGRRGAFLLNIPPDTTGMIPDQEFRRAAELGMSTFEIVNPNGAAEAGAGGGTPQGLQNIESGVIA